MKEVVRNELKRHADESQIFSLSSMNTAKRVKLCLRYGVRQQVESVDFDNIETVGDKPSPLNWIESISENDHAEQYITYIRDIFIGTSFLTGYQVLDVHNNPQFWNSGIARGTTDAVVVPSKLKSRIQDEVTLAFELKKVSCSEIKDLPINSYFTSAILFIIES